MRYFSVLKMRWQQNIMNPSGLKKLCQRSVHVALFAVLLVVFFAGIHRYRSYKEWWDWDEYVDDVHVKGLNEKVIVMGKMQKEDTDWVAEFLPR